MNYYTAKGINDVGRRFGWPGCIVSHTLALPFTGGEITGLLGDVAIDWIKGRTVNHESIRDEGVRGYINPFHSWVPGPLKGPITDLPGIHHDGSVDFEW
jgi:hypothetical protein